MVSRSQVEDALVAQRVFAILRGVPDDHLLPLAAAILEGGIRVLEVTYSDPNASRQIRRLRDTLPASVLIGAGTVTHAAMAEEAVAHGASFLVTPHVQQDVIQFANEREIGLVCGALTPTEIMSARAGGVRLIKVFPASVYGPSYFKALLAPYPGLELFAVGGISEANIREYLDAGAVGAAVGGMLTSLDWNESEFAAVTTRARTLVAAAVHPS